MEKKVKDILANFLGKVIQCTPKVVNAIEALKDCVLNEQLGNKILVVPLRDEYGRKIAKLTAYYEKQLNELREVIYALQRKLNTNSQNSVILPSQDPFKARGSGDKDDSMSGNTETNQEQDSKSAQSAKPARRKQGGQKGHKGHRQKLCKTNDIRPVLPERCTCGSDEFINLKLMHILQHIELPVLLAHVIHYALMKGTCAHCGKIVKASVSSIPQEHQTGYGSNFTAFIGAIVVALGCTRRPLLELIVDSGFLMTEEGEPLPLSLGTLNKLIDRSSTALELPLKKIREFAHTAPINYIDETSWPIFGPLRQVKYWLCIMSSPYVVYFNIHRNRSREAFHELIGEWFGYLISDGLRVYWSWPFEFRKSCLTHLFRHAKKWKEAPDKDIARGRKQLYNELCRLNKMQPDTLTEAYWQAWVMRARNIIKNYAEQSNGLSILVARLRDTFESLSTFLCIRGVTVEPMNHRAERSLRIAVAGCKISFGRTSEMGHCRIESKRSSDDLSFARRAFLRYPSQCRQRYSQRYATKTISIQQTIAQDEMVASGDEAGLNYCCQLHHLNGYMIKGWYAI